MVATNVTYRGIATYQCYAGFAFPSGLPTETIQCSEDGKWEKLPVCLASSCPPLAETPHATQMVLNGGGRSYGTVVRFECEPGYFRIGAPVILCMSDGHWSTPPPQCESKNLFIMYCLYLSHFTLKTNYFCMLLYLLNILRKFLLNIDSLNYTRSNMLKIKLFI